MASGIKKLLLLGAGHAHVHVLSALARQRPADLDVTLVSPYPWQTYSGMLPGFVAGRYPMEACRIDIEPLARAAGVRWVAGRCSGLDAQARSAQIVPKGDAAEAPLTLRYDLLSIDTGATLDRQRLQAELPGALEHALLLRPIEGFARLWPEVLALAAQRPLSVAVLGAGAAGIELLMAAEQRLRGMGPNDQGFTLVTGGREVAPHYPAGLRQRVLRRLKNQGITVLQDRCVGLSAGRVRLASGAELVCDVPILAIGTHAPPWLRGSGLALCPDGHVQVNALQQSSSHPEVFAAGDVTTRMDRPVARSGVYAVRAGPALAANLLAAHEGRPLQPHQPPRHTLNLLSCGAGHAIASYGPWHAEGAWAWHWKDRIDRGFVARYRL